uniref:Uncharacterized protein n=1 Tax=Arundo donax TaxID=35708 RepID=A0A0A8ZNR3_ARUDO
MPWRRCLTRWRRSTRMPLPGSMPSRPSSRRSGKRTCG